MNVVCEVRHILLNGTYTVVDSTEVVCSRCGSTAAAFGLGRGSVNRCMALLREKCPKGESNFYTDTPEVAAPSVPTVAPVAKGPVLPKITLGRKGAR